MITRQLNWVESIDPGNQARVKELERRLANFYSNNADYYLDINFTADNWIDQREAGYQQIVKAASSSKKICEVGCGSSNILKHHNYLESLYSGCDFSSRLMEENKRNYSKAHFVSIKEANQLPFEDNSFDLVFSVFVLEHSTNPAALLQECTRILEPGGHLIILCPDFLGKERMTSQRAGWGAGTAIAKLRKGKVLDALVTLYDNRIRIPFYCRRFARKAVMSPLFLVNLEPVVFEDNFSPDVDAVYVTFKAEIIMYLQDRFRINENDAQISLYEKEKGIIFLSLTKLEARR